MKGDWPETALHHLVRFENGRDYKEVEDSNGDVEVWGSGGPFTLASTSLYEGESVLFGRKGTVDKPRYVNGAFWTVDTMYYTVPGSRVVPKWLFYWATTIPFDLLATNTALPSMTASQLGRLRISLPTVEEQQRIADYLDRETATIDTMIEKQRMLVERLVERRRALISRFVLGLDASSPSSVDLGHSGGILPRGWVTGPVKRCLASLDSRRVPLNADDRGARLGTYPYYGASGIIDYVDDYLFDEELVLVGEDGANLLNRSTPLAFIASGQYWVNNHAHVLKPHFGPAKYWAARLEAVDFSPSVSGSTQPKLTSDALLGMVISWPSSESEMHRIVDEIDRETAKIDTLIAKAERFIELAQERRAALITAAVTGQISVD